MPNTEVFAARILAEAFNSQGRGKRLGAMGQNLPSFDVADFLSQLAAEHGADCRVAILGGPQRVSRPPSSIQVTTSARVANEWRNDAETGSGKKLFVLVLGDVPEGRLQSLDGRDRGVLLPVTEVDLRRRIRESAVKLLKTEKRRIFWQSITSNVDYFTVDALLHFASLSADIAENSNPHDVVDSEVNNAYVLGLLPDKRLLDCKGDRQAEKLIQSNVELVSRLRSLSKNDLRTLAQVTSDETAEQSRIETAKQVLAFAANPKRLIGLRELTFERVAKLLAAKKTAPPPPDDQETTVTRTPEKVSGDEVAIDDIFETGGENLTSFAETFEDNGDEDDVAREEVKVGFRTVVRRPRMGTSQMSTAVNSLITEERFGGIVYCEEASDYVECLKLLEAAEATKVTPFRPSDNDDKYAILTIVDRVIARYAGSLKVDFLDVWRRYLEVRTKVLVHKHALLDHPLLSLCANQELLDDCRSLVSVYGELMNAVAYMRDVIRSKSHETSKRLTSRALSLDVIFLRYSNGAVAVAGPTHPFHLWRWVQIADLLKAHREELAELGSDLLQKHAVNPPVFSPHLLLNQFVEDLPRDYIFVGIGSIGALPLYGDPESRTAAKFRADEVAEIARRFIGMAPYAVHGLEIVTVDAPSVADVLEAIVAINRGRRRQDVIPIHIRSYHTRSVASSTDEEDVEMEELAALVHESGGTLEFVGGELTLDQISDRLSERPAHISLVFEPGDAESFKTSIDVSPTLSPLIVPRHYEYDELEDQFHVIISGDATPFGAYYGMFRELLNLPEGNTIGRRSGASKWLPALGHISRHSMWISIIDQGLEPTLQIPECIRLDKRSTGGREVHTFTSYNQAIQRYVERIVQTGGLVPDSDTVRRCQHLMQRLGGNTIPLVVSSASQTGQIVPQQARGLLGVLAVTAWYERDQPDALLISLDTEASRRWILGAIEDDFRRGDLLCLRQTTTGLRLEVIEVKARQDEQGVVKVRTSKSGKSLEGPAIGQIDTTISILERILPADVTNGVDRARREVLRDQLYMAVANRSMTPEERERAVEMLHEFFKTPPTTVLGRLFLVHVETNRVPLYPALPRDTGVSPAGKQIEVFEITESEVSRSDDTNGTGTTSATPGVEPDIELPRISTSSSPSTGTDVRTATATEPSPPAIAAPLGDSTGLPDGLRMVVGLDPSGTKEIVWDTEQSPNFGFLVTGDSGSGKTQAIRSIIHDARKLGYPVLIFDFKKDYLNDLDKGDYFANVNQLTVYDVVNKGLPFNPFDLVPNEDGFVQPVRQAYEIAAIIQRVENLGEKQYNAFVEAICAAYEKRGFRVRAKLPTSEVPKVVPVFDDVIAELRDADNSHAESVRIRLQKFSDLSLFPTSQSDAAFEEMLNSGTVLLMNDSANEKLMQVIAEILIVKIHALIKRGAQPRKLRRLLVIDEAWRVARSQRLVELGREGRAFGVGILIGTQYPRDLPDDLISSLRTQLFLYNKDLDNQKIIVRQLCNTTTGADAQQRLETLANLSPFQGYLMSEQHKRGTRVNVIPYHVRVSKK